MLSQPLLSFPSAVPLGGEGLLGGLPLVCHHQKERTKPHAPRASCPAGCTGWASARQGWQDGGRSSPCLCCHLQELQKPCPERGQKDSAPPDPQMLHEHILRGTRAPGWRPGHPRPSPFPGLRPRAAARAFAQFADPKVLHFPACPVLGKASHVLSCASLLLCGWDREEEDWRESGCPLPSPAQVWSPGSRVHSPSSGTRQTPLTCCGL